MGVGRWFHADSLYEVEQVFGDERVVAHDGDEQPVDGFALPSRNNYSTTLSATGSAAKRARSSRLSDARPCFQFRSHRLDQS